MSSPCASIVLRRLADEAVRPYSPYGQQIYEGARASDDTARTCAYSFAASLRAVAEEFERCEAEDEAREAGIARLVAGLADRAEAAQAGVANWTPEAPVSGVAE